MTLFNVWSSGCDDYWLSANRLERFIEFKRSGHNIGCGAVFKSTLPLHIGVMSVVGAGLSAIINNVAALALLMSLDMGGRRQGKTCCGPEFNALIARHYFGRHD
jgi:hypothetical protein